MNIGRLTTVLRPSWSAYDMRDSTNVKEPTGTPRIRKLNLGVKKPRGSDID
jgi:hypothetical protein